MGLLHYFLGIKVKSTPSGGLFLFQAKYIQDIFKKAYMTDRKSYPTPMTVNLILSTRDVAPFEDPSTEAE